MTGSVRYGTRLGDLKNKQPTHTQLEMKTSSARDRNPLLISRGVGNPWQVFFGIRRKEGKTTHNVGGGYRPVQ
jgi:hypothetical protein